MYDTVDVVIASYKEDLRWLPWLPSHWCRHVYCTSPDRDDLPEGTILLPNVGREATQYLEHLVRNYGNYADVTLFLQGCPFDHAPKALIEIFLNSRFPHPICYVGASAPSLAWSNGVPFFKEAKDVFAKAYGDEPIGEGIPFSVGAQFYVRREVIMARPLAFYERLLDAAMTLPGSPGHYLEPSWGSVFDWKPFFAGKS